MVLTMEQSIVRQLQEMKGQIIFWQETKKNRKDQRLIEKCNKEIAKQKHKIIQVAEALSKYRENM